MKLYIADHVACYVSFIKAVEVPDECPNPESEAFERYREDDGEYVGHELGDIIDGYGGDLDTLRSLPSTMFDEREPAEPASDVTALLDALAHLAVSARTFRDVPKDEQEWTPLDDAALDQAFAILAEHGR